MNDEKFLIQRDFMWGKYTVKFGVRMQNGKYAIAQPAILKQDTSEEGVIIEPPVFFSLEDQGIQSLMDELWKVGARPRDIGTAGHLSATQSHLADMKTLVSKAYDVTL